MISFCKQKLNPVRVAHTERAMHIIVINMSFGSTHACCHPFSPAILYGMADPLGTKHGTHRVHHSQQFDAPHEYEHCIRQSQCARDSRLLPGVTSPEFVSHSLTELKAQLFTQEQTHEFTISKNGGKMHSCKYEHKEGDHPRVQGVW